MTDAGDIKARATLDNAEFMGALKAMGDEIGKSAQSAATSLQSITSGFGAITDALAGIGAAVGLSEFAKQCLDVTNKVDALSAAFKALNGPTQETADLLETLQGMEFKSLYDFEDTLGPAAKNMLMLGVSADDTAKAMQALADQAAAMKEGPQYIEEVSNALAKMNSHVVANQRDMKALQQFGIDAYGALAREIGTSVPNAIEEVKKGMISAQTVIQAVTADMEKNFGGAAERSLDSWKGAMHVLSESTEEAQQAIGRVIKDVFTDIAPIIKAAADEILKLVDIFKDLPTPVKDAIIIIPIATGMVAALAVAFGALGIALEAVSFNPITLAIGAAVGALALLGKWVYDNWPAIKAVIDELGTDFVAAGNALANAFAPVVAIWKPLWADLVAALQYSWDSIKSALDTFKGALGSFFGWIGDLFAKIPGMSDEWKKLGDIWTTEEQKLADAKAATDAKKKSDDEAAAASANLRKEAQQQQAQELAAANAAKAAAAERKKEEEAAKKAAEEQKKLTADTLRGYEALKAIAPDVAESFATAMGGIQEETDKTAKIFGAAWPKMSDAQKQAATDTIALGDAFKTLGVTTTAQLEDAATNAEKAYQRIQASGRASADDLVLAMDAVYAAHQKVADHLNADVKKAYDDGAITAQEYYSTIAARAQAAYDEVEAAYASGEASYAELKASEKTLDDARTAEAKSNSKEMADAYHEFGVKTQEELDKATAAHAAYKAIVDATADSATKAAIAFKDLGVTSSQAQTDSLNKLADAYARVETAARQGLATDSDLYAASQKLQTATQQHVDYLNQKWQDAYKNGEITAKQMYTHLVEAAGDYLAQVQATSDGSEASMQKVNAAIKALQDAIEKLRVATATDLNQAFHDLGVKSQAEWEAMRTKAETEYQRIADSAGANSIIAKEAWVNKTKEAYTAILQEGGTLTEKQKSELDRQETQLQQHLDTSKSMWKTAYDGIKSTLDTFVDDSINKLVTGDLSFGASVKSMLEGLGTTVINTFIAPFKKAITDFIANEMADLLGPKGLGGITDSLKSIGTGITSIFGGGASAAGGVASGVGEAGSAVGGAAGGAGSAAGSVSGAAAGSIASVVNVVSGVVSAITGVIGVFQSAKQETTLNAIEHNTRYTMMYVGDRADGGILGQMFKLNEELAYGTLTKAMEKHRDNFYDWTGVINPILITMRDSLALNIAPKMDGLLMTVEKISDYTQTMIDQLSKSDAARNITVNVSPQGLTTQDAARALGNQIAANLSTQMVPVA